MAAGSDRMALRAEQARAELRLIAAGRHGRDRLRVARILLHAHARLGRGSAVLGWLGGGEDPPRRVEMRCGLRMLVRRADAVPLYEQFGLDVYGLRLPGPPPSTIVDVGANVGYAAIRFARRYPAARLVCVEPEPTSRELLRANLELNGIAASVFDVAVVGEAGAYRIVAAPVPSGVAVAHAEHSTADDEDDGVTGVTLGALLDRAGVDQADLVKLDIEGSEWSVFADAPQWAARVGALVCELHGGGVAEADRLLGPHGFTRLERPAGLRFRDVVCYVRGAAHRI
ncbi:MAG: FkbM family methyltransferase [Solirubrobacteraceae bacterium]